MLGIGPRLNTVFKSRWKALGGGSCLLLLAYFILPAIDQSHQAEAKASPVPHKSRWAY